MELKERWNNTADSFQKTVHLRTDYTESLLAFLKERGALVPGELVADIGCGAGKWAIRFVQEGCRVLLADISDRMLAYARANLGEGADSCNFFEGDFCTADIDALGWRKTAMLCFAAMTPAVETPGDLEKFCAVSKRHCFISRFADYSNELKTAVCRVLSIPVPPFTSAGEASSMVEMIKSSGFAPELTLVDYNWVNTHTPEAASELFFNGRLLELEDSPENRAAVKAVLERFMNADGQVVETVNTHVAWIYWRTDL